MGIGIPGEEEARREVSNSIHIDREVLDAKLLIAKLVQARFAGAEQPVPAGCGGSVKLVALSEGDVALLLRVLSKIRG